MKVDTGYRKADYLYIDTSKITKLSFLCISLFFRTKRGRASIIVLTVEIIQARVKATSPLFSEKCHKAISCVFFNYLWTTSHVILTV